jgi:hypothetical protein
MSGGSCVGARKAVRRRLYAGGNRIRTAGPSPGASWSFSQECECEPGEYVVHVAGSKGSKPLSSSGESSANRLALEILGSVHERGRSRWNPVVRRWTPSATAAITARRHYGRPGLDQAASPVAGRAQVRAGGPSHRAGRLHCSGRGRRSAAQPAGKFRTRSAKTPHLDPPPV